MMERFSENQNKPRRGVLLGGGQQIWGPVQHRALSVSAPRPGLGPTAGANDGRSCARPNIMTRLLVGVSRQRGILWWDSQNRNKLRPWHRGKVFRPWPRRRSKRGLRAVSAPDRFRSPGPLFQTGTCSRGTRKANVCFARRDARRKWQKCVAEDRCRGRRRPLKKWKVAEAVIKGCILWLVGKTK